VFVHEFAGFATDNGVKLHSEEVGQGTFESLGVGNCRCGPGSVIGPSADLGM